MYVYVCVYSLSQVGSHMYVYVCVFVITSRQHMYVYVCIRYRK
jgi:hypothetical protein